jgi:hypothetical protein
LFTNLGFGRLWLRILRRQQPRTISHGLAAKAYKPSDKTKR